MGKAEELTDWTGQVKPWPTYTGDLCSPLRTAADLTIEIPARLSALCRLYGIDQNDTLWERQLLMALATRHVPGFRVKGVRQPVNNNGFICEVIDAHKAAYKKKENREPSTDAVVTEMLESQHLNPIIAGMSHGTLMRIYSGRNETALKDAETHRATFELLRAVSKSHEAMREQPPDSYARLFHKLQCRRQP